MTTTSPSIQQLPSDQYLFEKPPPVEVKVAEILVWINGRRGTVEDFIVRSAMFQDAGATPQDWRPSSVS